MLTGGTLSADNIQAQLQAAGSVEAPVVCQYVWGARPGHRDELILRDRMVADSGSSESSGSVEPFSERLWCLMDYYDPTSIVDNTGTVVERYGFSAFGLRSILAPNFSPRAISDYAWDFVFKGQFLDLESGFYNYGYRYYSTELGRWLSRDPVEEEGGNNLYAVTNSNPVNSVDHLGLIESGGNQWPPAMVPSMPYYPPYNPVTPKYPQGFSLCRRNFEKGSACDCPMMIGDMLGGEHSYLQYVEEVETGPPHIWGWGFAGATFAEEHFDPNSCTSCAKTNSESDDAIMNCIKNFKPTQSYHWLIYNCLDWAKEAADNCGLNCG